MFGFGKKTGRAGAENAQSAKRGRGKAKQVRHHTGPYTPEQRIQAVEAYLKSGMSQKDFAKTWGTSEGSLYNWVKTYEKRGPKGLVGTSLKRDAKKRGRKGLPAARSFLSFAMSVHLFNRTRKAGFRSYIIRGQARFPVVPSPNVIVVTN